MRLDENTGSIITLEKAQNLASAFNEKYTDETISSFIGANNVKQILEQEGCVGLRIYNGFNNETNRISLVIIGVDKDEKELVEKGIIYDELTTCPYMCPVESKIYKK